MRSELWNFINASFGKRLVLYETVVLSLTFFGTFPNLTVKFISFFAFVVTSGLFIYIFTTQFVSQLRLILAYRNREKVPISNEIAKLSKQMNVQLKGLGIVKGCTAYVIGKHLVLGLELLKKLNFNERQAVVAHELGHIKEKHVPIRVILTILLLPIPFYSWSRLYSPIFFTESITQIVLTVMVNIALLAYTIMIMILPNWFSEFRADKIAAKFTGKENIKSALLKFASEEKLGVASETHPSISDRVKRIEKLEP